MLTTGAGLDCLPMNSSPRVCPAGPARAFNWSEALRNSGGRVLDQQQSCSGPRSGPGRLAGRQGNGYLGDWSLEVSLEKQPLSHEQPHLNSSTPQAFSHQAPCFPLPPATTKSSEQRHFCKLTAKGQEAEMPRNDHGLTGKDPQNGNQISFHSSTIQWTNNYRVPLLCQQG